MPVFAPFFLFDGDCRLTNTVRVLAADKKIAAIVEIGTEDRSRRKKQPENGEGKSPVEHREGEPGRVRN